MATEQEKREFRREIWPLFTLVIFMTGLFAVWVRFSIKNYIDDKTRELTDRFSCNLENWIADPTKLVEMIEDYEMVFNKR